MYIIIVCLVISLQLFVTVIIMHTTCADSVPVMYLYELVLIASHLLRSLTCTLVVGFLLDCLLSHRCRISSNTIILLIRGLRHLWMSLCTQRYHQKLFHLYKIMFELVKSVDIVAYIGYTYRLNDVLACSICYHDL
jgi:hypothetical protein